MKGSDTALAQMMEAAVMQGLGLCTDMLHWVPGYAASGIIALISPFYVCVLPIMAPVRPVPHAVHKIVSPS